MSQQEPEREPSSEVSEEDQPAQPVAPQDPMPASAGSEPAPEVQSPPQSPQEDAAQASEQDAAQAPQQDATPPPPLPPPQYPAQAPQQQPVLGQGRSGKHRNPVLVWLVWPLLTLGIYHLYWWYKINEESRRLDPSIEVKPVLSLLALFPGGVLIVPPFVTVYRTGERIRSMEQAAGTEPTVLPIIGLLLMFVFSTYSLYYQIALNGIWSRYGNPPEDTAVPITPRPPQP